MLYTFIYIAIALHQRPFAAHAVLQVLYALAFLLLAGLLSGYALGFVAAARLFLLLLQSGLVCLPALCLCFLALTVALGLASCLLVELSVVGATLPLPCGAHALQSAGGGC